MSTLLAVDPGIRGCGVALFRDGCLVHMAYVKSPMRMGNRATAAAEMALAVVNWVPSENVSEVAVEWPQIYASRIRAGVTKEDPNDLLALTAVDAAVVAELSLRDHAFSYLPAEWKGQMTKEACHTRIRSRLSPIETEVLDAGVALAKSMAHNALDAVGIGLHHLGRFEKKRVIPG